MASAGSRATKGTIPKTAITAVLIKGQEKWMPVIPGSFDIVEVNFQDSLDNSSMGGVVGFKFGSLGMNGRRAYVFCQMDSIAAVQIEEAEVVPPVEGK